MNVDCGLIVVLAIMSLPNVFTATKSQKKIPAEWKLDRIECFSSLCHPFNCTLFRKTRTLQIINANCRLTKPQDAAFIHYQLFYRYTRYRPFLLDLHVDLCDALGNRTKFQPFMEFATPFIRKYTNLNHSCPFEGHVELRGMHYDNDLLKGSLIPSGQYRFDTRIYDPRTNDTIFLEQSYLTHSSTFTTKDLAMG